jgi:hypothetical protein
MNASDTHVDMEARTDICTSPRPAGTKNLGNAPRGSATTIAVRLAGRAKVGAAAFGAADWLCLAATPTFVIMALVTGIPGVGPPHTLCSTAPLSGMVPMYLMMSAFHSAPWLKLISGRRNGAHRS